MVGETLHERLTPENLFINFFYSVKTLGWLTHLGGVLGFWEYADLFDRKMVGGGSS